MQGFALDSNSGAWIVIFATALVTFLLRVSGYWLMARVPITPRVKRALDALPASLFVSTVAPIALKAGAPDNQNAIPGRTRANERFQGDNHKNAQGVDLRPASGHKRGRASL